MEHEDKAEKALSFLQEIQRDPITDRYLHVDLHEVKPDEKFEIRVPVRVTGESFGVKNQSGVLEIASHGYLVIASGRILSGPAPPRRWPSAGSTGSFVATGRAPTVRG